MKASASIKLHPAEQYARDAAAGRIVCSRWVKLAAKRHLDDLREGAARGLRFDVAAGQHALDFFGFLRHSKGEWAGQEFILQPWQQFIVWCLFGWKRTSDNARRFRTAYAEIARKNGKSTLAAGIGLYLFFADGEPGAEVFCVATKKDQAKIVFSEAERMRKSSPALKSRIVSFRNNMNVPATNSKFEPLSSDEDTLDGLNISAAIVDEYHAHKTRLLIDVIETATAARLQPLTFKITTAGYDRESVCFTDHEYSTKVLEGINQDDTLFVFIAALDEGDDWEDERNWPKANPGLNISVKLDDLRRKANKAKQDPSSLNSFLRLHLNIWTNQETAAIKMDDWNACVGFSLQNTDSRALRTEMEAKLAGETCYIGVDLSSTEDVTAEVKLFPPSDSHEKYIVLADFWLPEDNIERKVKEFRAPYDVWVREGFIRSTPGNIVDYDVIRAQVLADFERYDVRELTFDPWNATQFANSLQTGGIASDRLVKFNQTIAMFAEPTKRLIEELVLGRKLAHLGNPVLRWMASNLVVWEDGNGNKRPTKKSARGKIDGIVALIMALGRAIATVDGGGSAYDDGREILVV
jgi:phage terminase large subunit-like protein